MDQESTQRAQQLMEAIYASPLTDLAFLFFVSGALVMYVLLVKRHGLTHKEALLATVGLRSIPTRDIWFNLIHAATIIVPLLLIVTAMRSTIG